MRPIDACPCPGPGFSPKHRPRTKLSPSPSPSPSRMPRRRPMPPRFHKKPPPRQPPPPPPTARRDYCDQLARMSNGTQQSLLDIHNCYRALQGIGPLAWDAILELAAKNSPKLCGNIDWSSIIDAHDNNFAQNIGCLGPMSISQFYNEVFNCPDWRTCAFSMNTGHLINMMYHSKVGCALGKPGNPTCRELRCNYM